MNTRPYTLKCFRYAPGNYYNKCHKCDGLFIGDKRALTCKPCATKLMNEANEKCES